MHSKGAFQARSTWTRNGMGLAKRRCACPRAGRGPRHASATHCCRIRLDGDARAHIGRRA
eukprot:6206488-Pleurochrysis_carterae.AAC.2